MFNNKVNIINWIKIVKLDFKGDLVFNRINENNKFNNINHFIIMSVYILI